MDGSGRELSPWGRRVTLAAAVLGWLCAGVEMGLGPLDARRGLLDLLSRTTPGRPEEGLVGAWFGSYLCAFLLGGAAGGLVFGRLGDRAGRVRAMGLSILCFSAFTGASAFVRTPEELL